MNVQIKILILLVISFTFSCKEDVKKESKIIDTNKSKRTLINDSSRRYSYILINKALTTGDTMSYSDACGDFFSNERESEFLFTALIMANKYKYKDAYYDIYTTLTYSYLNESLETLDEDTKCLALYYLLKAKEAGLPQAIDECKAVFGNKAIPKSSYYLLKMAKN